MNHAIVVLDETGSMQGQTYRVVTSMNEYAKTLPKKTLLTVFLFDSERWTKFYSGKIKNWTPMEEKDYNPGTMTPLYDSIAKALKYAEGKSKDGDKVMIMVDTDGSENCSKEHTRESIKAMVDLKKKDGWEFLFMANGLDEKSAMEVSLTGKYLGMVTRESKHEDRMRSYLDAGAATVSYFNGSDDDEISKDAVNT